MGGEDGGYRDQGLWQRSVFAAKARTCSGYLPEHSEAASVALTGLTAQAAALLADAAATAGR
ncbi:DUF1702 family protein [Micromonospora sp. NPDC023633]|uniref:DUF1702 family protein n=1 Tax=Micromonospora sp. NPDC023633 TaxID=3154320 RepID=UPI0033FC8232